MTSVLLEPLLMNCWHKASVSWVIYILGIVQRQMVCTREMSPVMFIVLDPAELVLRYFHDCHGILNLMLGGLMLMVNPRKWDPSTSSRVTGCW